MTEQNRDQEHPLGPTEELLAREQAEAITRSQQPIPESVKAEAPVLDSPGPETTQQTEAEQAQEREREDQEQREWEAKRDAQGQEQASGWLQAPQDEGITSHPPPDASPASPGKEQHQQAIAEETGERSGGMKRTISTKTQLGAVVTLDGIYVVPRYQTVIKETPIEDKVSYMRKLAKERGSEPQPQERQLGQEKEKDRDRDRDR